MTPAHPTAATGRPAHALSNAALCAAAVAALAIAMGVGRFAFTPMLPLMLRDRLLTGDAGAWLAAANYVGYLVGAVAAARLPWPAPRVMAASLAGIVATTWAMGATGALPLWLALRFAAGVLSAWTMVATSAWALAALAERGRARLAGVVYTGVGAGIALAGLFCLLAARPGVGAPALWRELGGFAALPVAAVLPLLWRAPAGAHAARAADRTASPRDTAALVLCYGLFGFGYILPATFLPAMARTLVDDPLRFGLAWPLFGLAAALSTLLAATRSLAAVLLATLPLSPGAALRIASQAAAAGLLLSALYLWRRSQLTLRHSEEA